MKPTKTQIIVSNNMVAFTSMVEVLFSTYRNCKQAVAFDSTLLNKLKNLEGPLSKILKDNVNFIDKHGKEPMEAYHILTSTFEIILGYANAGDQNKLAAFLELLRAYNDEKIQAVPDHEYESLIERLEKAEKELEILKSKTINNLV